MYGRINRKQPWYTPGIYVCSCQMKWTLYSNSFALQGGIIYTHYIVPGMCWLLNAELYDAAPLLRVRTYIPGTWDLVQQHVVYRSICLVATICAHAIETFDYVHNTWWRLTNRLTDGCVACVLVCLLCVLQPGGVIGRGRKNRRMFFFCETEH